MSLVEGIHQESVEYGAGKVTYYDSAPQGSHQETILLLHGTGGSAENNFWALFPMLAMRHRVIALDFIDPDTDDPTVDHYVDQVAAVVSANPLGAGKKIHLMGYSFGAVVAAVYAARHSASISSLTLVAGWIKTDNHQRLRNTVWQLLYDTDKDALAHFTVFTSFGASFLNARNDAELSDLLHKARGGPDRAKKMRFNRTVDISEYITRITVPSLVVGCTQDLMAPIRHSRMLFSALPDARYFEINSGHGVVHERPSELFSVVDQFLRRPDSHTAGQIIENSHA